jgi:RND family efflux transporter MFP subunit
MFKMDYVSESQVLADRMSKQKSDISLLNARKKMEVLIKYTKDKNVTELEANIKKALSDELAKKATLELETSKEKKFEKQIAKCTLIAPGDGMVVYVNENNGRMGAQGPSIEEGAAVRERQKIFSLPDLTHMRVNTKIHESMINRLSVGLPAKIKVDAIPNVPLEGEVSVVGTMADQTSMFSSDVKQYTTFVSINTHESSLRPGMTAQVEILVTQLPDVISVPVQAVVQAQGKDFIFVMTADGYERREVKLGLTNQKMIEVQDGVKEGEEVAMNWSVLLSEDEKNALFNASVKGAAKGKDWTKVPPPGTANLSPGLNPGGDAPKGNVAKGNVAKGDPKAKGKAGRGQFKMFPDDPALQAKVDKIAPEDRRKMRTASDEEKAEIFKKAGLTEDEVKKYQDAAAAMMERFRNMGGGGQGGGGFGGGGGPGGGGFGGGGGGGGFGGGGPGGGGPPNGGGVQ